MRHAEIPAVLSRGAGVGNPGGSMDAAHRARAHSRQPSVQRDRARAAGHLALAAGVTSPRPGGLRGGRAAAPRAVEGRGVSPVGSRPRSQDGHRGAGRVGRAVGVRRAEAGGVGRRVAGLEDPPADQSRAAARHADGGRVRLHWSSRAAGVAAARAAARSRSASRLRDSIPISSSARIWRSSIVSGWDTSSTTPPFDVGRWSSKGFPRWRSSFRGGSCGARWRVSFGNASMRGRMI